MEQENQTRPALPQQGPLSELAALVDVTEQMLGLAKAGDWQALAELEQQRGPRLEAFFAGLDESQRERYSPALRQTIEYIMGRDKQIMALGEATKTDALNSLRQSHSARQATAAYRDNDKL